MLGLGMFREWVDGGCGKKKKNRGVNEKEKQYL